MKALKTYISTELIHNLIQNIMNTCRICLEDDKATDLIAPCSCSGTSAYVHRECLDQWRTCDYRKDAFYACSECNTEYQFENANEEKRSKMIENHCKFGFMIVLDVLFYALVVFGLICLTASIFYVSDTDKSMYHDFNTSMPIPVFYFFYGFFTFFVIIGLISVVASCFDQRSYSARHDSGSGGGGISCIYFGGFDGNGDEFCLFLLLLILIVFFLFGVIIGFVFLTNRIAERVKFHQEKIWRESNIEEFRVKDLRETSNI